MTRIIVIGLGNPILGDDGVGWRVAEEIQRLLQLPMTNTPSPFESNWGLVVDVECISLGGLSLMERLVGYDRAILIDAISTGQRPPGAVHCFPFEALPDPAAGHSSSAHDTSLKTALSVGRSMGLQLPDEITVVAVESESVHDFSEELSPPVSTAVPQAARLVIEALGLSPVSQEV